MSMWRRSHKGKRSQKILTNKDGHVKTKLKANWEKCKKNEV